MADAKTEKQKVKEITDKLEEGLKALFESEKYKSYLSTMSKFHNYSFNNTLLIAMQKPGSLTVYLLLLHKCNSILSLILAGFPAFFFVKFLKCFCSYF